jgi:hypothetical protein
MGTLNRYQDNGRACFSRVDWESGEPAFISVSQSGVLVKRSNLGFFGAKLYDERNIHDCVAMSRVLDDNVLTPESRLTLPEDLASPVLQSFTRLAIQTRSAAEFCVAIGGARQLVLKGL